MAVSSAFTVKRGGADGLFINTAGVGLFHNGIKISGGNAQPGDVIVLSGTFGDHGIAVLSAREGLIFRNSFEGDVAPLNHIVTPMLAAKIHTTVSRKWLQESESVRA